MITIPLPDSWPDYVVGTSGITPDVCKALNILVRLPQQRIDVFHAAMNGRTWMYYYEFCAGRLRRESDRYCEQGSYWKSVIEAVDRATETNNCQLEIDWFLKPIPDSAIKWQAATVRASELEAA